MRKCLICDSEGIYKCPSCLTYNCSVACYQAHKNDGTCELNQKKIPDQQEVVEDRRPDRRDVFTTIDTVPVERIEKLANSDTLKQLLENKHLRDLIVQINTAPNAENAMKLAMMEPLFIELADECFKNVEPQEIQE